MKQSTSLIVFCLFLSLLFSSVGMAASHIEVVAKGYAVIQSDLVQAIDDAISDALRRGIERALGTYIESYTLVQASGLVEDSILAKSAGYVSSYTVQQQSVDDGFVIVVVRMIVQKDRVENDLDALVMEILRKGDPLVAVLIPELVHGQYRPHSIPERMIADSFIQHGFSVVNTGDSGYGVDTRSVSRALAGDAGSLSLLKSRYNVDLVILGSAETQPLANVHGMISNTGSVEAKIIDLATGRILADHRLTETGQHLTDQSASEIALSNAGESMTDFLLDVMTERFISQSNHLFLEVYNIEYSELTIIEQKLKSTRGVQHIFVRDFEQNTAQLDVTTFRNATQLANEMSEARWIQFPLEVIRVSGNKIALRRY